MTKIINKDEILSYVKDIDMVATMEKAFIESTPSQIPLLKAEDIRAGTHITAVGSDTPNKQELDSEILAQAEILITYSLDQSRGEIFRAMQNGAISLQQVNELGKVIQDKKCQRTSEKQISVVDLRGVAVQDIMIAEAVYSAYKNKTR